MLFALRKRMRRSCALPLIVAGVLSLICGCAYPAVRVDRVVASAQQLVQHDLGVARPIDLTRRFIAALDADNLPAARALFLNPTEPHTRTLAALQGVWPGSLRDHPDLVLTVGPYPSRPALVHVPLGAQDVVPVKLRNATTNVTFSLIFQMTDTGWQLIDLRFL
ncbi:MAG: hypothetical protein HC828_19075 [Blastochloris sp.]|nr:hypothetical protein [Blastochloris sp.]